MILKLIQLVERKLGAWLLVLSLCAMPWVQAQVQTGTHVFNPMYTAIATVSAFLARFATSNSIDLPRWLTSSSCFEQMEQTSDNFLYVRAWQLLLIGWLFVALGAVASLCQRTAANSIGLSVVGMIMVALVVLSDTMFNRFKLGFFLAAVGLLVVVVGAYDRHAYVEPQDIERERRRREAQLAAQQNDAKSDVSVGGGGQQQRNDAIFD
jgi:apolipoprotein N-acyltransferase